MLLIPMRLFPSRSVTISLERGVLVRLSVMVMLPQLCGVS